MKTQIAKFTSGTLTKDKKAHNAKATRAKFAAKLTKAVKAHNDNAAAEKAAVADAAKKLRQDNAEERAPIDLNASRKYIGAGIYQCLVCSQDDFKGVDAVNAHLKEKHNAVEITEKPPAAPKADARPAATAPPMPDKPTAMSVRLTYVHPEENSNKEYNLALEPQGKGWVVSFRYGKIGSKLQNGSMTPAPVPYADAYKKYASKLNEKLSEQYQPDNTPNKGKVEKALSIAAKLAGELAEPEASKLAAKPAGKPVKDPWELVKSGFKWECQNGHPIKPGVEFYLHSDGETALCATCRKTVFPPMTVGKAS